MSDNQRGGTTPETVGSRKKFMVSGSDRYGRRAAILYSQITTAKMNNVDPQAWLTDIFARVASHPATRVEELMPGNWIDPGKQIQSAQAA